MLFLFLIVPFGLILVPLACKHLKVLYSPRLTVALILTGTEV